MQKLPRSIVGINSMETLVEVGFCCFNISGDFQRMSNRCWQNQGCLRDENICWLSRAPFSFIQLPPTPPPPTVLVVAHHAEMWPPGWHPIDLHSDCFVWGQEASGVALPESALIDIFSFAAINLSSSDPCKPISWTLWEVSTARLYVCEC